MISGDFEDVSRKELQSMADLIMAGHFQSSEKERREKQTHQVACVAVARALCVRQQCQARHRR